MKKVLLSLFITITVLCLFVGCEYSIESVAFEHLSTSGSETDELITFTFTSNGKGNEVHTHYSKGTQNVTTKTDYDITVDYSAGTIKSIYPTPSQFSKTSGEPIKSFAELKQLDKIKISNWEYNKVSQ